jgi:hypothetical protein
MNGRNPLNRVLSLVSIWLFALPVTSAYAQRTGEMPRIPEFRNPTPDRVITTPDFGVPSRDAGGAERTGPVFRDGTDDQQKGLEHRFPPPREPLPAISGPSTGSPTLPMTDESSLYWDRGLSRWDWAAILREARRAYAIEILIQEIEKKGEGKTKRDPEGYFYDGTYYRDDLPKWRATQDGFLVRLRTMPKPLLQSAVLRVGIEAMRPPPGRFGPGGPFSPGKALPTGELTDLKDADIEWPTWYRTEQGQWDLKWIAEDITRTRRIVAALDYIRRGYVVGDRYMSNPPVDSAIIPPGGEDHSSYVDGRGEGLCDDDDDCYNGPADIPRLQQILDAIQDALSTVPIESYYPAAVSEWAAQHKGGPTDDWWSGRGRTEIPVETLPPARHGPGGGRRGSPTGHSSPWGAGPSPGPQRPPQKGIIAGQGGDGGGSSIGPVPGQGGTLVGGGGGGSGGSGYSPWGGGSGSGSSGFGGSGSGGGPSGSGGGGGTSGSSGSAEKLPGKSGDTKTPGKGGTKDSKEGDDGKKASSEQESTFWKPDSVKGSPSGSSGSKRGGGEDADDTSENQPSISIELGSPPPDPTGDPGGGRSGGGDLGARRLSLPWRPITQQQKDLVGPLVGTTTGADDKDRPRTGARSGSVAGDPTESRANDIGGHRKPGFGGGGEAGSAFESLMRKLGLWEKWQAGGPDPPK